jgi:hypothetical protein
MKKKQFLVEIEIPDGTGDLCWDQDETGLQAFHDCVASVLCQVSFQQLISALAERQEYQDFIKRQNDVRDSFKVIEPIADSCRTKFTTEEIREYIKGFTWADGDGEVTGADLHNAYLMLEDPQDGIEGYFERQDYYKQQSEERIAIQEMEREELEDDYI